MKTDHSHRRAALRGWLESCWVVPEPFRDLVARVASLTGVSLRPLELVRTPDGDPSALVLAVR